MRSGRKREKSKGRNVYFPSLNFFCQFNSALLSNKYKRETLEFLFSFLNNGGSVGGRGSPKGKKHGEKGKSRYLQVPLHSGSLR
jgi:hypothetical protein